MILLIDNYDSFSYNVYQWIGTEYPDIHVARNDEITIEEVRDLHPDAIVLSPGPQRPEDAGICIDLIRTFYKEIPILGICLGHQSIAQAFGATITYAKQLMHGKQDTIHVIKTDPIFGGLTDFPAARYHSLSIQEDTLPKELEVLAKSDDDEIMAIKHTKYPVYGFQFHPESVMTPDGPILIKQFISMMGGQTK